MSAEQIMSADKYPSIFSRQMEAVVYLSLPVASGTPCRKISLDVFITSALVSLYACRSILLPSLPVTVNIKMLLPFGKMHGLSIS